MAISSAFSAYAPFNCKPLIHNAKRHPSSSRQFVDPCKQRARMAQLSLIRGDQWLRTRVRNKYRRNDSDEHHRHRQQLLSVARTFTTAESFDNTWRLLPGLEL